MASSYTLTFADPFKTGTIIVPNAIDGSGKNDYDTSLDLIGPGYTNYGLSYAQNFVRLLENFASPYPPANPLEGQLWYDTSDTTRKILRINNGTDSSNRWTPSSGIFQQPNDPYIQYGSTVREGDVWVDTENAQLKIRYGVDWKLVGPSASSGAIKSGPEFANLESAAGEFFPVILNWANNKVISVISNNEFTPRAVIDGFTIIRAGTNLTNKNNAKYYGVSEKADALVVTGNSVLRASDILRNRATSQTHTGTFKISDSNGLYIINPTYNQTIRLYSNIDGALLQFSDVTKNFYVGINTNAFATFNAAIGSVGINTTTNSSSPSLDVYGSARFSGTLSVVSSASNAVSIAGSTRIEKNLNVLGSLSISGVTTSFNKILVGTTSGSGIIIQPNRPDAYDIGSTSTVFRRIYAREMGYSAGIGSTGTATTVFYGRLVGTATRLETKREIAIRGHVTGTAVLFDGSANVVFTASITRQVFDQSAAITSASNSHAILVCNTSTTTSVVETITKANFLSDIYAGIVLPGTIVAYGGSTAPSGYLLCSNQGTPGLGAVHTATLFPSLFAVIGTTYGTGGAGTFRVPDMSTTTAITTSGGAVYLSYIIKT